MMGLATINGSPIMLDVGVHFINEPSFKITNISRVDEPLITRGRSTS